ncbi:MAG: hypothetical protein VR72_08470 [Clostridiaceae bacterium BRH_c20a]|nr:MAG: hypothetical protein VR72_08470 [Clostridiaceae bacterium BRH_c20a]
MAGWEGLWYLIGTIVLGMTVVAAVIYFSERISKEHATILIAGTLSGVVSIASVMSSAKFNMLALGGVTFVVAGGSMFWATISLGQDYLNEIYGPKTARSSVYAGFLGWLAGTIMMVWLLNYVPTPPDMLNLTEQAKSVLGSVARINMAAFVSYLLCSWTNIWVFDRMKKATQGKTGFYLWLRSVTSTAAAQLIDSVFFVTLAFAGTLPNSVLINIVIANLIVKWSTSAVEIFWLQPLVNNKRKNESDLTLAT